MEATNKKVRSANYTAREKETLFAIVADFKNVIENKRTDGPSVAEKNKIWKKIEIEFNFKCPDYTYRSWESLKKMYENQKKDLRKRAAEERRETYKTGGGPPAKKMNEQDQVLLEIVSKDTVFGLENPFDSDIQRQDKIKNVSEVSQIENSLERPSCNEHRNMCFNAEDEDFGILKELPLSADNFSSFQANHLKLPITTNLKQKPQKAGKNNIEIVYSDVPAKEPTLTHDSTAKPLVFTPKNKNLSRRRPRTTVQTSASTLHDKYDILVDKKIANEEFLNRENQIRLEGFQKKNVLELELLQYDIQLKKKQLEILENRSGGK